MRRPKRRPARTRKAPVCALDDASLAKIGEAVAPVLRNAGMRAADEGRTAVSEIAALLRPKMAQVVDSAELAQCAATGLRDVHESLISALRSVENVVLRTHPDADTMQRLARGAEYLARCAHDRIVPSWPGSGDVAFNAALVRAKELGMLEGQPNVFPRKTPPSGFATDTATTRQTLQWVLGRALTPDDDGLVTTVDACLRLTERRR